MPKTDMPHQPEAYISRTLTNASTLKWRGWVGVKNNMLLLPRLVISSPTVHTKLRTQNPRHAKNFCKAMQLVTSPVKGNGLNPNQAKNINTRKSPTLTDPPPSTYSAIRSIVIEIGRRKLLRLLRKSLLQQRIKQ